MAGMNPQIIVVSGIQASGKSTVARLLAERFERGVHIEADALQRMIVAGGVWAGDAAPGTPQAETVRQLLLRLHNACLLAKSFREAGFTAVVDDIIIGERLDHLRQELDDLPFQLVILAPAVETVIARDTARDKTTGEDWARYLDAELRKMPRDAGIWVDSTSQTAEQTVDEIMSRLTI